MTLAQLVIVPGILLGLFCGGLLVLAVRLTIGWLRLLATRRATAALPVQQYRALQQLSRQQGYVIDAVISEFAACPATYETFPQDVREALYAAHEAATRKELS